MNYYHFLCNNRFFLQDNDDDSNWDSWDGPSSIVSDGGHWGGGSKISRVEQQIQEYRMNQKKKLTEVPPEPEPEPDYFEVIFTKLN